MAEFIPIHNFVIKEEGGYQDMPSDTGNYVDGVLVGTNYGISAPVLKSYLGRTPSKEDMKNLSFDDSVLIYIKNYWNKILGDDIKNESVALIIYDGSVNHGRGAMKTIVSSCLKNLGKDIDRDNVFTKAGIETLNKLNQEKLFNCIFEERKSRYENGSGSFLSGHLKRLNNIKFETNKRFPTWAIISISVGVVALLTLSIYQLTKQKRY
jgi:lysozyme family protein